jgi:hypothetical protein
VLLNLFFTSHTRDSNHDPIGYVSKFEDRVIAPVLSLFSIIVDYKFILNASYKRRGLIVWLFDSCKTIDPFFASRQCARIIDKQQEYLDSRDNGK